MRPPSCARVRYAGDKLRGAARRCVAEVRPCQFWGLPVTFAATSTTIKSSAAFDGRTIPTFVDARPTQPLLTSRKVYATAHATRAARPTSSSRRAAVRRPRACPARYDAGRFVRPVTICELAGECTDRGPTKTTRKAATMRFVVSSLVLDCIKGSYTGVFRGFNLNHVILSLKSKLHFNFTNVPLAVH